MYVRVAKSQKFDEVLFQFPARIIAKIVVENTTVVAFLVDFVTNLIDYFSNCVPVKTLRIPTTTRKCICCPRSQVAKWLDMLVRPVLGVVRRLGPSRHPLSLKESRTCRLIARVTQRS